MEQLTKIIDGEKFIIGDSGKRWFSWDGRYITNRNFKPVKIDHYTPTNKELAEEYQRLYFSDVQNIENYISRRYKNKTIPYSLPQLMQEWREAIEYSINGGKWKLKPLPVPKSDRCLLKNISELTKRLNYILLGKQTLQNNKDDLNDIKSSKLYGFIDMYHYYFSEEYQYILKRLNDKNITPFDETTAVVFAKFAFLNNFIDTETYKKVDLLQDFNIQKIRRLTDKQKQNIKEYNEAKKQ